MSEQSLATNTEVTDTAEQNSEMQAQAKTYTQEEFDRHMAGLKASLQKKYEKTFAELGDIEELRAIKAQAEQRKQEEAIKKGEFDSIIKELAQKKDLEIQKRDAVIREYKVNTPILSAAARYRAVNAEQVKSLLAGAVKLNEDGEVEVVDSKGSVRYNDSGEPLSVDDLVKEFLDQNKHFVAAAPSTTNTKSTADLKAPGSLDISKLDMKNASDRQLYKEWMSQQKR